MRVRGFYLWVLVGLVLSSAVCLPAQSTCYYLVAGDSESYTHGSEDFLVYKLDVTGKKVWRKNYGGGEYDSAYSITLAGDGGYVVAGHSYSYVHGQLGEEDADQDFLVYKLDKTGKKLWRKNLGGIYGDAAHSISAASDGGFLVAGETKSYVHGTPDHDRDLLLYKLNGNGVKLWRKNFGGLKDDYAESVLGIPGGGGVLVGVTSSFTQGVDDDQDVLVYKLNALGGKVWRRNLGELYNDYPKEVEATTAGEYVIVGGTRLSEYGDLDFMVYKIDASGTPVWRRTFGGGSDDFAESVDMTTDGGFIVGGRTYSYGNGQQDMLFYKLDANGQKRWRKSYGGDRTEACFSVVQTSDGGYLAVGYTYTYVHGTLGSDTDILVYKLDANGNKLWRKNLGGTEYEYGRSVIEVVE